MMESAFKERLLKLTITGAQPVVFCIAALAVGVKLTRIFEMAVSEQPSWFTITNDTWKLPESEYEIMGDAWLDEAPLPKFHVYAGPDRNVELLVNETG